MTFPPIQSDDLFAIGLPLNVPVGCENGTLVCGNEVPKLVRALLRASISSPPPEDDRMAYIRHVRDLLMSCTDWTQANDSPLTSEQRTAWAAYRQALRDLPSVCTGDGPIPWPTQPA